MRKRTTTQSQTLQIMR